MLDAQMNGASSKLKKSRGMASIKKGERKRVAAVSPIQ